MTFESDKEKYLAELGKPDRSKKGGVDDAMWPLLDAINAREDMYTTSSCAGRTSVFVESPDGRKDHANWHFVSHDEVDFKDLLPSIRDLPKGNVWFKFEAAILHVVARNEDVANKLLLDARDCGFKHSGLLGTKKRWILELIDSERIDVPIAIDGKLIVDEQFIKFLVEKANAKLRVTRERMEKLRKTLSDKSISDN